MKKRLFALLTITALLLSGCGGETAPAQSESSSTREPSAASSVQTPDVQPDLSQTEPAAEPEPEPTPEPEPVPEPEPIPEPEPEPVTVTGTMDFSGYLQIPENAVPDLLYWANGAAEYEDEPSKSENYWVYEYEVPGNVVEEYITMLQTIGFTMVDSYYISGGRDELASWGFVCNAMPNAQSHGLIFTDTPCHLSIWTSDDDEYRMDVSQDLKVCDTGARRGGNRADLTPQGPSAAAGLIRLPDGSYQTSDGRLTAAVGTAAVLRDGQSHTCQASLIIDDDIESLWVEDYYRNEGFYFESPESYLMTNDLFQMTDLSRERSYGTAKRDQDAFNWGGCYFSLCHNGEWITPLYNGRDYEALTIRVMYDEKGGDRVYYVYARFFGGEPQEVEALVAVSTDTETGALDDARYLNAGDTVTLNCTWNEFGSKYHVYEWSVTEGEGNVVLDSGHDSCQVTAVRPGVAVVEVNYRYTKEEPDVLLGTPRDNPHSKRQEFVFVIQ